MEGCHRLSLTALALVPLVLARPAPAHTPSPQLVPVPIAKAYVPIGFDDNDLVQLVVAGTLTSSCEWTGPATAKVDTVERVIWVQANAIGFLGSCLRTSLPFHGVVDVGLLPAATYTVRDRMTGAVLAMLPVAKAGTIRGTGPYVDDDTYALVDDAFVWRDERTGRLDLVVDVKVQKDCARVRSLAVDYHPDVIVARPTVERSGRGPCGEGWRAIRLRHELRRDLEGTHLVHVRGAWGRALSKLVTVDAELDGP